jgi:protein TonB
METNKILDADILDLVFDGRNKEYGAYDLRKHYNGRLGRAIAVTSGVVVVLFCFGFVSGRGKVREAPMVKDIVIEDFHEKPAPKVIVPPVVPRTQPPVATRIFTAPVLVEHDVPDNEKPPVNDDLDKVKIGTVNAAGGADVGVDVGPVAQGADKGLVERPKSDDDNDGKPFVKVEIESHYPGGDAAWLRYLNKNLRFPQEAIDQELSGSVVVRFIVDKDGTISDVEAIGGSDNGGIRDEVVRVIKKSGKWVPAVQNGRYVKSYKQQPVTFQLSQQ